MEKGGGGGGMLALLGESKWFSGKMNGPLGGFRGGVMVWDSSSGCDVKL